MSSPNASRPSIEHPLATPTMQAIAQTEYGSPAVLHLETVARPTVPDDGVLVSIRAASVDAGIWHLMRGTPFLIRLIFGGWRQPKIPILGSAIAGQVAAVGDQVTQFQVGDEVFGDLSTSGFGGFAEYASAPASALAPKPSNLTFEAAATVPVSGLAALQGLRDVGHLQAGQKVLVLGASGGVGSFAVQLAKAFGAEVTGVCSTAKVDMVRQLGADRVIDYTQTDVAHAGQRYDLILDAAAFRSVFDYLPILAPKGTYVLVGGSILRFFQVLLFGAGISRLTGRTVKCVTSTPNQTDLLTLKEFLEAGKITPVIDRIYPLQEVPDAIRYLEERHVQGKVAIRI
jgi:NADPH:quinone reductase-like Zn-dependent oxidoreductase